MEDEDRDQIDGLDQDISIDLNVNDFIDTPPLITKESIQDPLADANTLGIQLCAAGAAEAAAGATGVVEVQMLAPKTSSVPAISLNVTNNPNAVLATNILQGGQLSKVLANPADNDALVDSLRNEDPTQTVLNNIMVEIAEEAAYLKAWRATQWAANPGQVDMSEATHRRIKMLADIVETLMKKERLIKEKDVGKIDFYGENFKHVLKYFLEVISETFNKVHIPEQYNDIFFAQLAKEFDGFEKKAEKIYYNKQSKK